MANVEKGIILTIEGPADRNGDMTRARVSPSQKDGLVSRPLTIPWYLRGATGNLAKGTEVVYTLFDDHTGIIISRLDGEWGGVLLGDIEATGKLTAEDVTTDSVSSFNGHTHGGVTSGSSNTSGPQ